MAVVKFKHYSNVLNQERELTIIGDLENSKVEGLKVMYFLHGLGNDNNTVLEKTKILQHAMNKNFIIIFPNADRSFYSNTTYGANYYNYITQEIPQYISKVFKFNLSSNNLYIAGISMGGYGALKVLFNNKMGFKHAISFSGSLDIVTRDMQKREKRNAVAQEWESIFGENLEKEHDLFYLSSNNYVGSKITLIIGKEDYLYSGNKKLYEHLKGLDYDVELIAVDGEHDYDTFSNEIDYVFGNVL